MSIIKNINLTLKLGFMKISIIKNFPLVKIFVTNPSHFEGKLKWKVTKLTWFSMTIDGLGHFIHIMWSIRSIFLEWFKVLKLPMACHSPHLTTPYSFLDSPPIFLKQKSIQYSICWVTSNY